MAAFAHITIPKRTVALLFDFSSSIRGVHDLGEGITLKETVHVAIQQAMDAFLSGLRRKTGESFITYLSPHERDEFDAALFCLEHQFEAPDEVDEAEKRSKAEIVKVLIAMRAVKSTLAKPGLYLGWEKRGTEWELRGFEKVGFDVYHAPGELEEPLLLESFSATDVASVAEIMPRVRRAYVAHGRDRFNRVANALNFFETGYRSNFPPVRFVVFTTALESLFITSDESISRQFRERISRFLARDSAGCQQLEDTCREIYDARSAIIHGQPVPGGGARMNRLTLDVQGIGRHCLRRVLADDALFDRFCGPASDLERLLEQVL